MYFSGRSIIRCTSRGNRVALLKDSTTGIPIEMLGTKWPSITSTWITSAPPCSTARISSPRRATFDARMDGAISMRAYFMPGGGILAQGFRSLSLGHLQANGGRGVHALAAGGYLRDDHSTRGVGIA